jgi:hypothetical protein
MPPDFGREPKRTPTIARPALGPKARRPRLQLTLGTTLIAIAALALLCAWGVPWLRRALGWPNTWLVKTIVRPDGTRVRVRVRRYPDRDVVHKEVLPNRGAGRNGASLGTSQRPGIP